MFNNLVSCIRKLATMNEMLQSFITQFVQMPGEDLDDIGKSFRHRVIKKNEYLLRAGEVNSDLVFVLSGCVRMYYFSGDTEVSAWFSLPGSIAMEVHSFISGTPSVCSLHAIADGEVLILPKNVLEQLYVRYPVMQELMRKIWEQALLLVIPRFLSLQNDSAETRYRQLLQQPDLLHSIPQKYLASFIGVTPTSLSRIRNSIMPQ